MAAVLGVVIGLVEAVRDATSDLACCQCLAKEVEPGYGRPIHRLAKREAVS